MLTDIFADRYASRVLWNAYTEAEAKLLNQSYRIVVEQLFPYWVGGEENISSKASLLSIHDQLSMELGLHELAPKFHFYQTTTWQGTPINQTVTWKMDKVCKDFVCTPYAGKGTPDRYVKERISFIELAFRLRGERIQEENAKLPKDILEAQIRLRKGPATPKDVAKSMTAINASVNAGFRSSVEELNERLRRAGTPLDYHNGFLQISSDLRINEEIEQPFWSIVADPMWENVDMDMKEALDRRDDNGRDPVFHAARALESTIKIISEKKGWTHGRETGAHSFIDNLGSSKNGEFIAGWEREALKLFFKELRNPFGHGPGSGEMPKLTEKQTDWAIESCMSWIKSLVGRM
jgi:hypothetical protein